MTYLITESCAAIKTVIIMMDDLFSYSIQAGVLAFAICEAFVSVAVPQPILQAPHDSGCYLLGGQRV